MLLFFFFYAKKPGVMAFLRQVYARLFGDFRVLRQVNYARLFHRYLYTKTAKIKYLSLPSKWYCVNLLFFERGVNYARLFSKNTFYARFITPGSKIGMEFECTGGFCTKTYIFKF